jgi:aspartate oxidase
LSFPKLSFSPMTTPLKVVVVGGGIAGLTLANALEVRYLVYYHQRHL